MKITLPNVYSQLDPKYSSTPIGSSNIGAIGCLTVDAAMAACYFGHYETPSTLASKINYSGNYYIWGELSRVYPDIKYSHPVNMADYNDPLTDVQMAEIQNAISQGFPVFLKIKTANISEHWILAVDYNGDDFFVADPLKGTVHAISDWGIPPREVIYAYGWYTGTPMNVSNIDPLQACLTAHAQAVASADAKDAEIKQLKELIDNLNQNINDRNNQLTTISAKVSTLEAQLTEATTQRDLALEQAKQVPALKEQNDYLEQQKSLWANKEQTYISQIKSLQTKMDQMNKPLKSQLADIWMAITSLRK